MMKPRKWVMVEEKGTSAFLICLSGQGTAVGWNWRAMLARGPECRGEEFSLFSFMRCSWNGVSQGVWLWLLLNTLLMWLWQVRIPIDPPDSPDSPVLSDSPDCECWWAPSMMMIMKKMMMMKVTMLVGPHCASATATAAQDVAEVVARRSGPHPTAVHNTSADLIKWDVSSTTMWSLYLCGYQSDSYLKLLIHYLIVSFRVDSTTHIVFLKELLSKLRSSQIHLKTLDIRGIELPLEGRSGMTSLKSQFTSLGVKVISD